MNDEKPHHAVSLRDFLSTSTKLAASAAALGTLPVDRFAHGASPGDTIKVALVGAGGRGTGAADHAMQAGSDVKLVAVADVHPDRMERSLASLKKHKDQLAVKEENKFLGFDAYKQAIAQADVVILATPPGFRPMMFEEAVRQGKHVFMEKPVAVDGPGVRKVLAAAEEAKKKPQGRRRPPAASPAELPREHEAAARRRDWRHRLDALLLEHLARGPEDDP